jgi:hypothetical protein
MKFGLVVSIENGFMRIVTEREMPLPYVIAVLDQYLKEKRDEFEAEFKAAGRATFSGKGEI